MLKPNRIAPPSFAKSAPDSSANVERRSLRRLGFREVLWRAIPSGSLPETERRKDRFSARQWLREWMSWADVLTMLEFRHRFRLSPDACRTYCVEIVFALWQELPVMEHPSLAHRKESHYAVA